MQSTQFLHILLLLSMLNALIRIPLHKISAIPDSKNNPASYYKYVIYVGEVFIGPQKFRLLFDTGSSPMWVMTPYVCGYDCGQRTLYNVSDMFCDQNNTTPFTNQYGSGKTRGCYVTERVALKELAVLQQEVGLLFSVDDDILKFDMDGILGLAFPGEESHSLLVNILQQYNIEPVFSFYLRNNKNHFLIGTPDFNLLIGSIHYIPIEAEKIENNIPLLHHWNIKINNATVWNGLKLGENMKGILDTGTADIGAYVSYMINFLQHLQSVFPADGKLILFNDMKFEYQIPCNSTEELYTIYLDVGGFIVMLGKDELVQEISNELGTTCRIRILIAPFWVLGTSVHNKYFVQYHMGRHAVGFAIYAD